MTEGLLVSERATGRALDPSQRVSLLQKPPAPNPGAPGGLLIHPGVWVCCSSTSTTHQEGYPPPREVALMNGGQRPKT